MRPGESVRYEFFYEPGETHVYPCLDQVRLLARAGRSAATTGSSIKCLGIGLASPWTNAVENPKGQKVDKIPLKGGRLGMP